MLGWGPLSGGNEMTKFVLNLRVNFPPHMLALRTVPARMLAVVTHFDPAGAHEDVARIAGVGTAPVSTTIDRDDLASVNPFVQLYATDGGEPIAVSPVHYGVRGEVEVVIDFPDPLAGRSEYERVTAMLAPWLMERPLAALPAEERAALPRISGVDEALIDRLAAAQAHAVALVGPPEPAKPAAGRPPAGRPPDPVPALYALVADAGEVPLAALLLHSRAGLARRLAAAAEARIAPPVSQPVVEALIYMRDKLHFNLDDDGRYAPAKALRWAPLEPGLRSQLLDAELDAGSGKAVRVTPEQKALVAGIFTLFDALGRHAPMLAALAPDEGGAMLLRRGALDRLHLMAAADWRALIERAGHPSSYAARPEPAAAYAADIVAAIAAAAPGQRLAARLRVSKVRGTTKLADALADHPTFDIRTQPVQSYFAEGERRAVFNDGQISLLAAVQRTTQLAPDGDFAVVEAMLEQGFTSGYSVLAAGKAAVRERLSPLLGVDQVDRVYSNAQQIFADTYALCLAERSYWPTDFLSGLLVEDGPELPNLTTLFGNADFCACAHCQSVYGPAAYLADLLHWMRADVVDVAAGANAYNELAQRRPDIPKILLNCANANTAMPYIDIVNEVLSYPLLASPGPLLGTLQTHGDSADRMLEPEYRGKFDAVDALLLKEAVQWGLPYDSLYDEARAYLEAAGRDHAGLVETLSVRGWTARSGEERTAWACARFGIIAEELAIIATDHAVAGSSFWKTYWGLQTAAGASLDPGSQVKPLLGTGEFADLAALEALLKTGFVHGGRAFPFDHIGFAAGAPCDVDQAFLADSNDAALNLGLAAADRLMRFERLRRRAGLSVAELDHALAAFGTGGLDTGFVCRLAAASAAAARLGLPLDTLSDWFKTQPGGWPADCAAALGITAADLDAAGELLAPSAEPWKHPDYLLQFLFDFDGLRDLAVAPAELLAMLKGTGRWQLDAAGKAADKATAKAAKAAWEAVEAALDPVPAVPDAVTAAQLTPAALAALKAARANAVDLALASALGLSVAFVSQANWIFVSAINTMAGTTPNSQVPLTGQGWRALFDQPRESVTATGVKTVNRSWDGAGAIEGLFTEYYRYLWRCERIAAAAGFEPVGLQIVLLLAAVKESPSWFLSADFPVALDLAFNRFGSVSATGAPLIWLRRGTRQAAALAVSQMMFLMRTSAFKQTSPIPNFGAWATAEMDAGSVLAGRDAAALQRLAVAAQPFEPAGDFGALVARMLDLAGLDEDLALIPTDPVAGPLPDVIGLVWTTAPGLGGAPVENRFTRPQADQLKAALKAAAGGAAAWTKLYQPITNRLRRELRDALVAYYLGQHRFADIPQLYAHFLIDPEMEPCMQTSRIVQATNACQTLIQRGLLGLEANVVLDEGDKKQWVWRKNYRVWEANRKVFLYPENWIDPSLRLVKTPLFAAAQEQLLQDELNAANVEKAFNAYLTRLEDISRLDIRGQYFDDDPDVSDDEKNVTYVFARTWNPPHTYFYRRREKNRRWTAWEEIPIDIEGDHLIPVLFNRRLYLFWPTFAPKEHRTYRDADDSNKAAPYVELRLCYSKLEFGKWSPKKQYGQVWICGAYSGAELFALGSPSDDRVMKARLVRGSDNAPYSIQDASLEPRGFYFWAEPGGGDLTIHVRRLTDRKENVYHLFTHEVDLVISGCDERLAFKKPSEWSVDDSRRFFLAGPSWTVPDGMQLVMGEVVHDGNSWPTLQIRVEPVFSVGSVGSSTIMPGDHFPFINAPFVLTFAHQSRDRFPYYPFFFADRRHTHLIGRTRHGTGASFYDRYLVELHEHPYCCRMLRALHQFGIEGLLAPADEADPLRRQQLEDPAYFYNDYHPTSEVSAVHPTLSFDFAYTGAYAAYNWETFFHLPALIGHQLRLDGKHAEALRWLSFIFDPTNRDTQLGGSRFWMIKPFHKHVTEGSIAALMQLLQSQAPQDQPKRQAFAAQIAEWQKHPFEPHAVAEMRIQAYMRWTVMEYIETLLDWGDKLFRQFTTESVNEALQLYMLAEQILGPEPRQVAGKPRPDRNFEQLLASIDEFSNAAEAVENMMTGVWTQPVNGHPRVVSPPALYFCIPENPQLLAYWDRVADRLFKIRHCRDIDGNERALALFAPEIDPGMLVKAVASGLDLADILDSLAAPNPRHRFSYLLQRASDYCNEVKALGGQLLAAIEKRDAEALADLRQVHEINLLGATRGLKKLAAEEAKQSLAAAEYAKKLAEIRLGHYSSREFMIAEESAAKKLTEVAHGIQVVEHGLMILSAALSLLDIQVGVSGPGPHVTTKLDLAKAPAAGAQAAGAMASSLLNKASRALTAASYVRRQEDWTLQANLAAQEVQQADRQIAAAEIRLAMAEKELENHDLQVEQSKAVHDWMRAKFTGEQLYGWMSGKLKTLHRQAYNLAFDLARQAQRAFQLELGRTESYVEFGDWDSSRSGLLAGEMLSGQLRALEAAYMRFNTREFELTRSISLRLLAPEQLVALWSTGKAEFVLPPWLLATIFRDDMTLYAMRIKSVALSLPCVTGPHVAANVKLSLKKSTIGWKPGDSLSDDPSAWADAGVTGEIVTSSAVNDPALFEANLRDERYLPFENAGAVSQWTVTLPATEEFDRQTIADVILHLRFVARGSVETDAALPANKPNLPDPRPQLLTSWRHDFPDEWTQLLAEARKPGTSTSAFELPKLQPSAIPYRARMHPGPGAKTPAGVWIVHRNAASGERTLTAQTNVSATFKLPVVRPAANALPAAGDVLTYDHSVPKLLYAAPGAGDVVEDVLITFKM